ncbi:MAG TPA: glutamate racemase [Candidatus Limnocylindrales bacterium]|nr:glutamate racemase [Candidatus Limnocylindrales bacterium]
MKIGVFDSGVGGLSVAQAIERALPEHTVVYRDDHEHVPYGSKTPDEVLKYVEPILRDMAETGCGIIVIACNTVSTTLIDILRERLDVPLVAMEPMVKPAAQLTRTGVIAVCATPATLASDRYAWLKRTYAPDVIVLEPDCSDWAAMIEQKQVERDKIDERISACLDRKADVIVLGCTHYHWIEQEIATLCAGRALVIQPEPAIIKRLEQLMSDKHTGAV